MPKNLHLPNLNRTLLAGYATGDAVLRHTPGGVPVANFTLAHNRRYTDKDGEWTTAPSFIPLVLWNERAEQAAERVHKGTAVLIEGHLQSRSWETDDGKRTVVEIVIDRLQVLEKRERAGGDPSKEMTEAVAGEENGSYGMDQVPF